jgi:hypothetical protein
MLGVVKGGRVEGRAEEGGTAAAAAAAGQVGSCWKAKWGIAAHIFK